MSKSIPETYDSLHDEWISALFSGDIRQVESVQTRLEAYCERSRTITVCKLCGAHKKS